jgi:hypothetical protein
VNQRLGSFVSGEKVCRHLIGPRTSNRKLRTVEALQANAAGRPFAGPGGTGVGKPT